MLHHMRNEDYWLSFSAPSVDGLFGTLPSRGTSVPLTDMAKKAHGVQAAKTAIGGGGSSSSSAKGSEKLASVTVAVVRDGGAELPVPAGAAAVRR